MTTSKYLPSVFQCICVATIVLATEVAVSFYFSYSSQARATDFDRRLYERRGSTHSLHTDSLNVFWGALPKLCRTVFYVDVLDAPANAGANKDYESLKFGAIGEVSPRAFPYYTVSHALWSNAGDNSSSPTSDNSNVFKVTEVCSGSVFRWLAVAEVYSSNGLISPVSKCYVYHTRLLSLFVNILAWTCMLCVLHGLCLLIIRMRRHAHSRCVGCGYSIIPKMLRCSECGQIVGKCR